MRVKRVPVYGFGDGDGSRFSYYADIKSSMHTILHFVDGSEYYTLILPRTYMHGFTIENSIEVGYVLDVLERID